MNDLGDAMYILRIKIYRDRSKRLIGSCQDKYIEENIEEIQYVGFQKEYYILQT